MGVLGVDSLTVLTANCHQMNLSFLFVVTTHFWEWVQVYPAPSCIPLHQLSRSSQYFLFSHPDPVRFRIRSCLWSRCRIVQGVVSWKSTLSSSMANLCSKAFSPFPYWRWSCHSSLICRSRCHSLIWSLSSAYIADSSSFLIKGCATDRAVCPCKVHRSSSIHIYAIHTWAWVASDC